MGARTARAIRWMDRAGLALATSVVAVFATALVADFPGRPWTPGGPWVFCVWALFVLGAAAFGASSGAAAVSRRALGETSLVREGLEFLATGLVVLGPLGLLFRLRPWPRYLGWHEAAELGIFVMVPAAWLAVRWAVVVLTSPGAEGRPAPAGEPVKDKVPADSPLRGVTAHPALGLRVGAEGTGEGRWRWVAGGAVLGLALTLGIPVVLEWDDARTGGTLPRQDRAWFVLGGWRLGGGRLWVERSTLQGTWWGPMGSLSVHREYRNTKSWPAEGAEVDERLWTPAVAALRDFWITEGGVRVDAVVAGRGEARGDYERTVRRFRDPGLLEFEAQGRVRFNLYPVLPDGSPKDAAWTMDGLWEPDSEGWVAVDLPVGSHPVRGLDVSLEIRDPRGVGAVEVPAPLRVTRLADGGVRVGGAVTRLAIPGGSLRIRWRLGAWDGFVEGRRRLPVTPLVTPWGDALVQVAGVPAGLGTATASFVGRGAPEGAGPCGRIWGYDLFGAMLPPVDAVAEAPGRWRELSVPRDVWDRLSTAAACMRVHHGPADAEGRGLVARAALEKRMVTPLSSLYAKPGRTGDAGLAALALEMGPSNALSGNLAPPPALPEPEAPSRGGLTSALLVPNFRRARERSSKRACFANQKTLAGALEMYCLDNNVAFDEMLFDGDRLLAVRAFFTPRGGWSGESGQWWRHRRRPLGSATRSLVSLVPELVTQGYLQSAPYDPGYGAGSEGHYFMAAGRVGCCVHGFIEPPQGLPSGTPVEEQLRAAGVEAPDLLALAASEPAPGRAANRAGSDLFLELELLPLIVLWDGLDRRGRFCRRRRRASWTLWGLLPGTLAGALAVCSTYGPVVTHGALLMTVALLALDAVVVTLRVLVSPDPARVVTGQEVGL